MEAQITLHISNNDTVAEYTDYLALLCREHAKGNTCCPVGVLSCPMPLTHCREMTAERWLSRLYTAKDTEPTD